MYVKYKLTVSPVRGTMSCFNCVVPVGVCVHCAGTEHIISLDIFCNLIAVALSFVYSLRHAHAIALNKRIKSFTLYCDGVGHKIGTDGFVVAKQKEKKKMKNDSDHCRCLVRDERIGKN